MRIDFNLIDSITFPGMNNGTGMMSARMYNDEAYRIIPTAIHPGGSIGTHKQDSGDDMNYIISGIGKAFCDGIEEALMPGVMHICPKGSEHSIVNTGEEDLLMLTIVVKK
ncbi:MAG: cupin domain-containing protein [Synergistaceae bacterium]|nr:cupin domain-containing protein [Synergistaceae bacterium]MBR0185516.1 cupin domain-containing protein [Synergistaceae bacterium]